MAFLLSLIPCSESAGTRHNVNTRVPVNDFSCLIHCLVNDVGNNVQNQFFYVTAVLTVIIPVWLNRKMADNTNKIKRYFLVTIASVLTMQSSQFSKEQWICHPDRHCQHDDFYGFTKQVGHSSLGKFTCQRKFRRVLTESPASEIFSRNRQFLSDRLTRLFKLDPKSLF